jgi:hypothetical protein
MGSVVISGSTSGTVTVSAPAEAGTRTLTLPAATGTAILEDGSNNLQMNSGFGSSATAYGVRAWVNFTGTGTVAILESGNVSSITDNGTGNYTVTFTNNMTDKNYAVNAQQAAGTTSNGAGFVEIYGSDNQTVSSVRIQVRTASGNFDPANAQLAVIR